MDIEKVAQVTVNYGLGIVLSLGMAIFMGWLLKYVFHQNEIREAALSELIKRDIASNTKAINDHDERTAAAIKNIEEANRRQREEHLNHQKALDKIEEENDRRREAQVSIIAALTEINLSLKSLNEKDVYFQRKKAGA